MKNNNKLVTITIINTIIYNTNMCNIYNDND